jgi:BMFP domain-containing protein YqiC
MAVGTFFQTVPPADVASQSTAATATETPTTGGNSNATTQLSEAIDEFLADVEKKFKLMNDEILTKCPCLPREIGFFQLHTDTNSG